MKISKIIKVIGAFLCVAGLIPIGYIAWHLIYSASSVTCLESKPEDSFKFGEALAINGKYIAVGDPEANRVAIYSYDKARDKWSRTREIHAPKNSIIDRVGSGFGNSLVFNQDQLIISAYSKTINKLKDNRSEYSYYGAVYSLLLDDNNQNALEEIVLPESFKLTGYSITTFNNKIALEATTGTKPGQKPSEVLIVNPNTLKVESTIESLIPPAKQEYLGKSIAGNSKSLIINGRDIPTQGGVYFANKQGELVETVSISEIPYADETRKFRYSYSIR